MQSHGFGIQPLISLKGKWVEFVKWVGRCLIYSATKGKLLTNEVSLKQSYSFYAGYDPTTELQVNFKTFLKDDVNLFDYIVEERVNDFVAAALSQADITCRKVCNVDNGD